MAKMMMINTVLYHRYRIDDLMPSGGQAALAQGVDQQTGQAIVIKQLQADPGQPHYREELARFQRAGRIRIGHPHVVDALDLFEEDDCWYMIMPYIDGPDLAAYLAKKGGRLPPAEVQQLWCQVAEGLAAIHAQGYVHRDLKPGNLLRDHQGQIHIIDLGICKNLNDRTITQGQGLLGTIWWMAPEQISHPGREDARVDIYAQGVIFYTALTGRSPVQGEDAASLAVSICFHQPPSPRQIDPAIPADLDSICMKALAKSPDDRFQDDQELLDALYGLSPSGPSKPCCPVCGQATVAVARYCIACGASLMKPFGGMDCLACGQRVDQAPMCPGCGLVFGSTPHRLRFVQGALTGRTFRIPQGNFIVGREQLDPRERYISRNQFHVTCHNGHVQIQNVGGVNPTCVQRQPALIPTPLTPGMELTMAGNMAMYETY